MYFLPLMIALFCHLIPIEAEGWYSMTKLFGLTSHISVDILILFPEVPFQEECFTTLIVFVLHWWCHLSKTQVLLSPSSLGHTWYQASASACASFASLIWSSFPSVYNHSCALYELCTTWSP